MLIKKILSISLLLILFSQITFSIEFHDVLKEIKSKIEEYNKNEISFSQFIVYLEDQKNQCELYFDENDVAEWTFEDLKSSLGKRHFLRYETKDFYININPGGDEGFFYNIETKNKIKPDSNLNSAIKKFKSDIKQELKSENPDFSQLSKTYFQLSSDLQKVDFEKCNQIMKDIFSESDVEEVQMTTYSEYLVGKKNKECLESCKGESYCNDMCEEQIEGVKITTTCMKGVPQNLIIENRGREYEQKIRSFYEHRSQSCHTPHLENEISLRLLIQESLNDEFMNWYLNDFLKDNMKRSIEGEDGFLRLMRLLIENEEKISQFLSCKQDPKWPEQFKKIKLDYKSDNNHFKVWEEMIKVKDKNGMKVWSTMYTYKFIPNKDTAKKILKYQISNEDNIGPDEEEIKEMKSEPQLMELIGELSKKFDNSMDFEIILKNNDEEILKKSVKINKEDVILISNQPLDNLDFTATLEFDALYDFADYMITQDSKEINGPYWIETDDSENIMGRIRAVLKLWSGGISIKPWTVKFKLMFSINKIIKVIKHVNEDDQKQEEDYSETKNNNDDSDLNSKNNFSKISFTVEINANEVNKEINYMAQNLDTDYPDLKVESEGTQTIVLGKNKIGWIKYSGTNEWTPVLDLYEWDTAWDIFYNKQFKVYYNKIKKNKDQKEIKFSLNSANIRIYNINNNPSISNKFSPN